MTLLLAANILLSSLPEGLNTQPKAVSREREPHHQIVHSKPKGMGDLTTNATSNFPLAMHHIVSCIRKL